MCRHTLAWEQLCKGPEAGLHLGDQQLEWCELGKRVQERKAESPPDSAMVTVKPVSPSLLWNVRLRRVGTSRWGSGWCPLHMEQCWRDARCPGNYLWELLCVHLGEETLPGHAPSFWEVRKLGPTL